MLETLMIASVLVVFEVLAARFGVSSRDGEDWTERYGPHMTVGA